MRNKTINRGLLWLVLAASPFVFSLACGGANNTIVQLPDSAAPVTTASPAGGDYGDVQYVLLASNENAAIYYSLDGADPEPGAPNTATGPGPLFWIRIGGGTSVLKFFAIDASGNREPVRSETYTVTIPVAPLPYADAGPDQTVSTGSLVTLDGNGSGTANGVEPAYRWSFMSMPAASAATLSSSTIIKPTFTADRDGAYVISLVVNDGQADSAADTVTITAVNTAPVANAGPDQYVAKESLVTLDGSKSRDANGDVLTYSWSLSSMPAGSAAMLSNPAAAYPIFTTDLDGTYVASLVVNDGMTNSTSDTVVVRAARYAFPFDDGTLQGWTANGFWGVTTTYAYSSSYSVTDSPNGNYSNNSNTYLMSPLLDLTGAAAPALRFYHRYSIENYYDHGYVEVSTNGGATFGNPVLAFTGTYSTFTLATLDLSPYKSSNVVVIRFRLVTNSVVTNDGWYIDNIMLFP